MVMDSIDWVAAQWVGELLAGSPSFDRSITRSVEPLVEDVAGRVSAYSELEPPANLPPLETVDRGAWIEANLRTMRPLLEPLSARMGSQRLGALAGPMESFSGLLLGAQVGAVTGILSQRVLGQYDLALLDPDVEPRLLLVAPNLAHAARTLSVNRGQLVAWVTIHELTHAVQFGGVPWLRAHLAGIIKELIDGLEVRISASQVLKWGDPNNLRELAQRLRHGELMRITLGEQRWSIVERMQATMSLVEGHAEHVMDAVGADLLPALPQLRAAMTRRRENRGTPWKVLERLLGLELKLRQYEVGRAFCDAVVASAGPAGLARVWSAPEALPTTAELAEPALWLERTQVLPVTK
jgi:coenzyme F420 biosynthesis associated uncharacterized protein